MRGITKLAVVPIAGLLASAGALLASGPAMASGCSGASCTEGQSVTVQASITETLTTASFAFNGGNPVTAGTSVGPEEADPTCTWSMGGVGGSAPLCPETTLNVVTGDGAGYTVGSYGTDFAAGAKSFPVANLKIWLATGGGQTASGFNTGAVALTSDSAHPVSLANTSVISAGGGDNWAQFDQLNLPSTLGNGNYSSTVSLVAVGN